MRKAPSFCLTLILATTCLPGLASSETRVTGMLHPRLSPDGSEIAVSWQGAISKVSINGGTLVRLTRGPGWDLHPAWSPDGKTIAFQRTPNFHSGRVVLLDATTGEVRELTKPIRAQGRMSFSPKGDRLFGLLAPGRERFRPGWFDLATGEFTALPLGPDDPDRLQRKRPAYVLSADGSQVIYAIHRDEPEEQGGNRGPQADVWMADAEGTNARQLFTWPARIYDLIPDADDCGFIIVTDFGSTHNDLWHLPLSDSVAGARRLSSSHADDERPSYDSLGHTLVWTNNAGGATRLVKALDEADGSRIPSPIIVDRLDFGEPTGQLLLEVVDAETGKPVTARISLQRQDGKAFAPADGALYRLTGSTGHFYADRKIELELPVGNYRARIFRGPEYEVSEQDLRIAANEEAEVQVPLTRWSHLAKAGWYSGENHVHANYGYGEWYNTPATILRQAEGEDLNVCNTVIANSDGEAIFDREFFLGQLDPRSTDEHLVFWGQEFRSTLWGHMTLSSLSTLVEPIMTGFQGTTNPWDVPTNADIAQRVNEQRGLVGYTHPAGNRLDLYDQPYAAKGLPVDAALGRVRLMDIHGHTYEGSIQLWYRLMNCGLRIAGSSGTDVFLNRVRSFPPGWARTYVHLPGGLTYAAWTEGQRAGRSFFTNGPILEFSVDGAELGGTLSLGQPGPVRVTASARSRVPLDRVELVANGAVIQTLELDENSLSARFEGEVMIENSGWLALRAHGPAHHDLVKEADAHTNPVYLEIEKRPNPLASRDAAYFLKWIDRLERELEARDRIPNERLWKHVRGQLDGARDYYRSLAVTR